MSMNIVILRGRLTRDPEMSTTQSGVSTCKFTLAVDGLRRDDNADFVPCKAFNKTADIIGQYCTKGKQIEVVGRLSINSYKDSQGQNKTYTAVLVNNIDFISDGSRQAANTNESFGGEVEEEVPF